MRLLRSHPARAAGLLTFLVLLATTDERSFGLIPDGQQMLFTAASMARFGEIGISRELGRTVPRPAGDAVSRYPIGPSLLLVPSTAAARALRRVGPGAPTAPLFVLVPMLLLAVTAAALAAAALELGLTGPSATLLGVAGVLATPLWGYAGSDFSEPLQVATLALCLWGFLRRSEAITGAAGGAALLAKTALGVAVSPVLLLALVRFPRRARLVASCALPVALWGLFDLVRFGRLVGGYGNELSFSYPPLWGLLRLLVLPNKGLLVYAPLLVLAPLGALALFRKDRALAAALAVPVAALFGLAATWWNWDGEAGWGPRLVVPTIPFLVVFVASALHSFRVSRLAVALSVLGVAVNLLGALIPFPFVYALASLAPPSPISESRAAGTEIELVRGAQGTLLAEGPRHLALTPSWSPIALHARLLFGAGLPFAVPAPVEPKGVPTVLEWSVNPLVEPRDVYVAATAPFGWPFFGRSFVAPRPSGVDPYTLAMRDQAIRALDLKLVDRADSLARELTHTAAKDVALRAEAATRLGRFADADALLLKSDPCHLWLLFVRAERGLDLTCLPEADRVPFQGSVHAATSLPGWYRSFRSPG